jgi:hypothetical protein
MVLFGRGQPNAILVVRLYDPSDNVIRIDSIQTDRAGYFNTKLFTWPDPSRNLVFGKYTVEVLSSDGDVQRISVDYTSTRERVFSITPANVLSVKLDSPDQAVVGEPFRIFVQVTFEGALVNSDEAQLLELLGSSHVHSGETTINLSGQFKKLHEGLYYADVILDREGTYIIHAIGFYRGFEAHDSRVIPASSSSIQSIQESVDDLNQELKVANQELARLQEDLDRTAAELNSTRTSLTSSVQEARNSIGEDVRSAEGAVNQLVDASGQLNSIILPVLALISVILALQISLFARIRASYK